MPTGLLQGSEAIIFYWLKNVLSPTQCPSLELEFPTDIILIPMTARRLSRPAQDATKRLQAKIGVVCDGRPEKLGESVQELLLDRVGSEGRRE